MPPTTRRTLPEGSAEAAILPLFSAVERPRLSARSLSLSAYDTPARALFFEHVRATVS